MNAKRTAATLAALFLVPLALALPASATPRPQADGSPDVGAKIGGVVGPDGKTQLQLQLPGDLHRRNTSSKGLGNCVFTSIHHSALWQAVPQLQEFPQWLITKGIPGGGYPQKVKDLIPKISKERGMEPPDYLQVEDTDLEILKLACRTGRMPGVTYGFSPTGRYGGAKIAHMVSLVHADDSYFVVLDNNYIGDTQYEWMSPAEFKKTYTSGGATGWAVILLNPGPPRAPIADDGPAGRVPIEAAQWGGGSCGPFGPALSLARFVPFIPTPIQKQTPEYAWHAYTDYPGWLALYRPHGTQVGAYEIASGRYYPVVDYASGRYGAATSPPAAAPPIPANGVDQLLGKQNFGVDSSKLHNCKKNGPRFHLNGEHVSRERAIAALTADGKLTDDSKLLDLTLIGPEADRKKALAELFADPDWQKARPLVKITGRNGTGYEPDDWQVKRKGFVTTGRPTVYVQEPSGKVVYHVADWRSAKSLLDGILRRKPAPGPDDPQPWFPNLAALLAVLAWLKAATPYLPWFIIAALVFMLFRRPRA